MQSTSSRMFGLLVIGATLLATTMAQDMVQVTAATCDCKIGLVVMLPGKLTGTELLEMLKKALPAVNKRDPATTCDDALTTAFTVMRVFGDTKTLDLTKPISTYTKKGWPLALTPRDV